MNYSTGAVLSFALSESPKYACSQAEAVPFDASHTYGLGDQNAATCQYQPYQI